MRTLPADQALGGNRAIDAAHRQAIEASVKDLASMLQDVLTRRLTVYMAGVRDAKTVTRWATGESPEIRDLLAEQRLRTAYEIVALLSAEQRPETVRAWFIGLNPHLDNASPAQAIRDGHLAETLFAAQAFRATA